MDTSGDWSCDLPSQTPGQDWEWGAPTMPWRRYFAIHRLRQACIGPKPTFQAGERVWYLDTQPSKLDPTRMDEAWTWPWVVFFKEAPDLYWISAYSQATGRTIHTAHIRLLRRSSTGIQEGSAENGPGKRKGDLPGTATRETAARETAARGTAVRGTAAREAVARGGEGTENPTPDK
ncbi:MAG: hypothetical protein GY696_30905 [Gammaproteobacteria bacterium]|nr:hypothetical protein [Gammaproteobacteria bacterium]